MNWNNTSIWTVIPAVGMTQEMHNGSADFSFVGPGDETSDVANPIGSHEVLNPLYKELTQLCDCVLYH
ncbi:hypothetical protein IV203_027167 [Nitzschia inconspicua]|uniref:Uncharacterized protein n=1 Tax=Nitzschia inconspicua TaxID=303405 RepID=A0A9K3PY64_9STRA|nr:hypothetical protein IV203_027167 [Nitzschia inconspicua]